MLSMADAADYAGVSKTRAFQLTTSGAWRSIMIGRTRRVYRASIIEWLAGEAARQGVELPADIELDA